MEDPEAPEYLCDLEGTDVTLKVPDVTFPPPSPTDPPLHLSRRTWVIEKKLSERIHSMTQEDVDEADGMRLPFAAAKFLCHPKDDPSKKAFIRIYLQIPVHGTQYRSPQIRRQQANGPRPHHELTTLKALKKIGCDVIPDLLACEEGKKQGQDGIVPGGYMTYVVWDKVPGEPLSEEEFWELDLASRDKIRKLFRETFLKLKMCGYIPLMTTTSKIIYDKATNKMHFSGFFANAPIEPNEEWNDKYYHMFGLAKRSERPDWRNHPASWTW